MASNAFADVVIVKSSDADPYRQAESALRDRLSSPIAKFEAFSSRIWSKRYQRRHSTTDPFVAIGTPAAVWLHNQLPRDRAGLLHGTNADAGLLKRGQLPGVTTEVVLSEQLKLIQEALPSGAHGWGSVSLRHTGQRDDRSITA